MMAGRATPEDTQWWVLDASLWMRSPLAFEKLLFADKNISYLNPILVTDDFSGVCGDGVDGNVEGSCC